jgi:hypothetical protein
MQVYHESNDGYTFEYVVECIEKTQNCKYYGKALWKSTQNISCRKLLPFHTNVIMTAATYLAT